MSLGSNSGTRTLEIVTQNSLALSLAMTLTPFFVLHVVD